MEAGVKTTGDGVHAGVAVGRGAAMPYDELVRSMLDELDRLVSEEAADA